LKGINSLFERFDLSSPLLSLPCVYDLLLWVSFLSRGKERPLISLASGDLTTRERRFPRRSFLNALLP
jgi:hypothetical protein